MEITKADLEALSRVRLEDAVALRNLGRHSAAYYLAGYAVELALKACIAATFRAGVLPDNRFMQRVYSHNLEELLGLGGSAKRFGAKCRPIRCSPAIGGW